MMKLRTLEIPASLDLGGGPVLHFRKPNLVDLQGIRAAALRALAGCENPFSEEDPEAGGETRRLSAEGAGAYGAALAFEVCRRCLTKWDGIVGDDDAPLPVSPDAISALLAIPDVFTKVRDGIVMPILNWGAEKNASAPSRAGTSQPGSQGAQVTAVEGPSATGAQIAKDVPISATSALTH